FHGGLKFAFGKQRIVAHEEAKIGIRHEGISALVLRQRRHSLACPCERGKRKPTQRKRKQYRLPDHSDPHSQRSSHQFRVPRRSECALPYVRSRQTKSRDAQRTRTGEDSR